MFNIINIEDDKKYFEAKLYLTKPNRKRIAPLKEAYNKKLTVKLGNINELSFDIPYYIKRDHKIIKNPLIENIKLGFFVKLEYKGKVEYFVVNSNSKALTNAGETVSYKLPSVASKLGKYDVYEFTTDTETFSQTMGELLETTESGWRLGYVNPDFDLLFRSVKIESSTVLESIFTICTTFGAIPEFDTVRKIINFQRLDLTGGDKGLEAKEGHFLDSYNLDSNLDEIVTRLKCYGYEGLEFRSLTSTGSNYIQDFSYFMYPFEHDGEYNVVKSSNYMSDELCIALAKYEDLVQSTSQSFNNLVNERTSIRGNIQQVSQSISNLTTQQKVIENELDIINLTYGENARNRADWLNVNSRLDDVLLQKSNLQSQIDNLNSQLSNVNNQITSLGQSLATENNFTQEEISELSEYIYVKEFSDDNIITEEELLKAGMEVFDKYRQPKFSLSFSLANFINDFHFKASRKKINLGDLVTFNSKKFNTKVQTRILQIDYDLDVDNITVTTSNDVTKLTDEEALIDLFTHNASLSKTLEKNIYKLDLAVTANTEVNRLIENGFDTARTIITGGIENTNEQTERGFYSRDYFNPENTFLVINGGIMAITNDGGRSVEVAISKDGVIARRLVGSVILGNRLQIESESGVVSIFDNQVNIKDAVGTDRVQLGRYVDPNDSTNYKYGLNILDGAIDIRTSQNANRGMQMDSTGLRAFNNNGARTFEINAVTGDLYFVGNIESSVLTGSTIQTTSQPNRGIKINSNGLSGYDLDGNRRTYIDVNSGTLTAVNANFSGNINASTISGGSISGTSITGGTITGVNIIGNTITGGTVEGTVISGGTITGTDIVGGTINITTNARVGNILRIGESINGTFGNGIVFGSTSTEFINAYIRVGTIAAGTFMDISGPGGISLLSNNGITLNSNSGLGTTLNRGDFVIRSTRGASESQLRIVGNTSSSAVSIDFSRVNDNSRYGAIGFDAGGQDFIVRNNIGSALLDSTISRLTVHAGFQGVSALTSNNVAYVPMNASSFDVGSRREYKKNIEEFKCLMGHTALQKVNSTKVYNYNLLLEHDNEMKHTGLILDEAPVELVNVRGTGIDIYAMASVLWKAVQELSAEVEKLKG